ncbi:hypothetical protein Ade02nite_18980 [Paractinoplanes deccanensis]|uniref:Antitoxin n=1 Tax=Paractinoplanes deccanensis TaxID=113561 RepID=A0ABQ3XZV0_9ACTN|nr:type II toxin-antitoxin system Phd/YefM family antitoxin [Actinoplanes deccanensis]GID73257.1 hypothetical protein Ade02nite_18980 [Actinoplanes deccanensis]
MTITTTAPSDRSPHRNPYDLDMAKRVMLGIQELRLHLKDVITRVTGTAEKPAEHVVFTRHGKPTAVLVPMDWYRQAAEKMGEPTDL